MSYTDFKEYDAKHMVYCNYSSALFSKLLDVIVPFNGISIRTKFKNGFVMNINQ